MSGSKISVYGVLTVGYDLDEWGGSRPVEEGSLTCWQEVVALSRIQVKAIYTLPVKVVLRALRWNTLLPQRDMVDTGFGV